MRKLRKFPRESEEISNLWTHGIFPFKEKFQTKQTFFKYLILLSFMLPTATYVRPPADSRFARKLPTNLKKVKIV